MNENSVIASPALTLIILSCCFFAKLGFSADRPASRGLGLLVVTSSICASSEGLLGRGNRGIKSSFFCTYKCIVNTRNVREYLEYSARMRVRKRACKGVLGYVRVLQLVSYPPPLPPRHCHRFAHRPAQHTYITTYATHTLLKYAVTSSPFRLAARADRYSDSRASLISISSTLEM